MTAQLARWTEPLFDHHRYKILYGGRASGKSYGVADALLIKSAQRKQLNLCSREFQNSIKDSVHRLLAERIAELGLGDRYIVQRDRIIGHLGSEFVFYGVQKNVDSIKSIQGVDNLWVEEAHNVSEQSWRTLLPTIRAAGSEVWVTMNPHRREDPSSVRWIEDASIEQALRLKLTYQDNPFITEEVEFERLSDLRRLDPQTYNHVWLGDYLENSESQVLHGKIRVAEVRPRPSWSGPYHGLDHGFSVDPMAGVCCWIHDERLYIEHEAVSTGVENHEAVKFLKERIPGIEEYELIADCAEPKTNSYLAKHGLPKIVGCKKWPGSIRDGIKFLRSFKEIVIDPRCVHTIREGQLYSYKVDKLSGQPTSDIIDAHNNTWDAVRYALERVLRRSLIKPIFGKYGN